MIAAVLVIALWAFQRALFDDIASAVGLSGGLAGLGLVLGLAPILLRVLYHRYTHAYEIEDGHKLRITAGFIARQKREFPLGDKVQTDITQTVAARLLNYGTIAFWTGDDRSRLEWHRAPDPDRVVAFLDSLKTGESPEREPQSQSRPSRSGFEGGPGFAIRAPSLKEAKSTKITHFGRSQASLFKPASEMVAKKIDTPFGAFIDNDDGTVTCEKAGLMFIRAPWGMIWNGSGFVGEPINLKWNEAVHQFGKGADVGYTVGDTMAYMGQKKRAAAAFENGYKAGRCRIDFAGYKDWRLPTANELHEFAPYAPSSSHDGALYPDMSHDEQDNWRWRNQLSNAVFTRLYPELSASRIHLWTATGLGTGLAWVYDRSMPPGDHKTNEPRAVLFVRRASRDDLRAHQTVSEEIPKTA